MAKSKQGSAFQSGILPELKNILPYMTKNPDLAVAMGVLLILSLLIIPLPPVMLDMFLAVNIAFSVLILLVAVYLKSPLEFSSFPTVLLISTIFRLGLNVASTRLILGEANAGDIIHAFGEFVIKGNYVVGVIIFLILLIINFVVVIKGSTRIAEVTARFTLDALPGKQMSIDADLNAGFIDEQTARKRRSELTAESDFFGSMDGAAKFIKGDAIAGLIIAGINILGGFIIGIMQLDMELADAAATYTILTIGDGLVSQIPSLLISIAAGLVVTRSASSDNIDVEMGQQFAGKPKPMALASFALFIVSFLPGFPPLPFWILSLIIGYTAFYRTKQINKEEEQQLALEAASAEKDKKPEEAPVEELLRVDPVEIELGYSLISLVDESQGGDVFKRITNVRRQLATELGIILPPVRVRDNLQLDPQEYIIKIRGNEIARNVLHPQMLLAMNPGTADGELKGIQVTEPVFGLPATWIAHADREDAEVYGYTVVEAATVLTTHLTELLRRNSHKLLTRQDTKHLLDNLKNDYPALIEEASPDNLPTSVLQKVLQNLLMENIPVRDLPIIIESLLEYVKVTQNVDVLTEYVRHNLSETIKKLYQDQNGVIHAIAVSPQIEDQMTQALQSDNQASTSVTLGLPPNYVQSIQQAMSDSIDEITMAGYLPVVICSAQVRPYLYRMVRTPFPMVSVISYTELPADSEIEIQAQLSLDGQ